MREALEGRVEGPDIAAADVRVTLAGASFAERLRERFVLRLDDGTAIEVDPSAAAVATPRPERERGTWRELSASPLGARLRTVSAGPHVRGELEASVIRAGDRARVEGVLERPPPMAGPGYRAAGPGDGAPSMRAELVSTGAPAAARAVPEAPPPVARVRVDRFETLRLVTAATLALAAVALLALPAWPSAPSLAFLYVAWIASLLALATMFYERARAVPTAMPGAPTRRFLPRFVALERSASETAAAGTLSPFLLGALAFSQGVLAPGAFDGLGPRVAARFSGAPVPLDASSLDYAAGGVALGLVALVAAYRWWQAREDLAIVRELLRAKPGAIGAWGAWVGRVREPIRLRHVTMKYETHGAGRSQSRWAVMQAASDGSRPLAIDTEAGPIVVVLSGATAASIARVSEAAEGWTELVAAGTTALVVGTARASEPGASIAPTGPGTVLVLATVGARPRAELWRRLALHHTALAWLVAGLLIGALAAAT